MGHGAGASSHPARRSPFVRLDQQYRQEGWERWPWALPGASGRSRRLDTTPLRETYFDRDIPAPNGSTIHVTRGSFWRPGLVFEGEPATAAEFLRELADRSGGVYTGADRELPFFSSNGLRARMLRAADAGTLARLLGENDIDFNSGTRVTIGRAEAAPEDSPRIRIRYHPDSPMMSVISPPWVGGEPIVSFDPAPSEADPRRIFEQTLDYFLVHASHELAFDLRSQARPSAVADALAEALSMAGAAGERAADAAGTVLRAIPGEQPDSLDIMRGALRVGISVTASWTGNLGITFYFDQLTGVFALHGELVRQDDRIGIDWETAVRGEVDEPAPEAIRAFLSAMFVFDPQGGGTPSRGGGPSGKGGPAGRTLTSEDAPSAAGTIQRGAAAFGGTVVVSGDDETGTSHGGDADTDGASPLPFDITVGTAADGIGVPLAPATPWATSPSAHPLAP